MADLATAAFIIAGTTISVFCDLRNRWKFHRLQKTGFDGKLELVQGTLKDDLGSESIITSKKILESHKVSRKKISARGESITTEENVWGPINHDVEVPGVLVMVENEIPSATPSSSPTSIPDTIPSITHVGLLDSTIIEYDSTSKTPKGKFITVTSILKNKTFRVILGERLQGFITAKFIGSGSKDKVLSLIRSKYYGINNLVSLFSGILLVGSIVYASVNPLKYKPKRRVLALTYRI